MTESAPDTHPTANDAPSAAVLLIARAGPGAVLGAFFLAALFGSQGFAGCGILMMAVIGVAGAAMLGGMLCVAEATRPVGLFLVWSAVAAGATFIAGLALIAAVSGQPL